MRNCSLVLAGACLSLASLSATAHDGHVEGEVAAAGAGYVTVGDTVLKSGLNECLHTGSYTEELANNTCEGIEEPAEEKVAEVVAPAPTPQKAKIDTRDISEMALFDFDQATLSADGVAAMQDLMSKVAEYKGVTDITVTGHTDDRGSEEYNQDLSVRRARTVADLLSAEYPDAAMCVAGMGETSPIATNTTPEGRQQNRRVDVDLTATRMTFE